MSGTTKLSGEIVKQLIEKYHKIPISQMARIAQRENPLVFNSIDHARSVIRYYMGSHGEHNRKSQPIILRSPEESLQNKLNPFGLPESRNDNWAPMPFPIKRGNGLILADIQIPYHDMEALTLAIKWGKDSLYTDFILLLGDIVDCYQLSKFEKDPNKRRFKGELDDTNIFIDILQKQFPKAQIIFKMGNHENRLDRFLMRKSPELTEFKDYIWEKELRVKERGMIMVPHDVPLTVGKLNIIHGHELKGTSTVVNPARGAYLKAMECILEAHWHRTSQHAEMSFSRRLDTAWSIGCLCCLWPEYARINKWNHGVCGMKVDGKDFEIDNKRIFEGMIR